MNSGYEKYEYNCEPVCPYCDEDHLIIENSDFHLCEAGVHEIECLKCGNEYIVNTYIRYSTKKKD